MVGVGTLPMVGVDTARGLGGQSPWSGWTLPMVEVRTLPVVGVRTLPVVQVEVRVVRVECIHLDTQNPET